MTNSTLANFSGNTLTGGTYIVNGTALSPGFCRSPRSAPPAAKW